MKLKIHFNYCKILTVLISAIIFSCAQPVVAPQKISDPLINRTTGAEAQNFYLPAVPLWADIGKANCHRESDVLLLDWDKVVAAYHLDWKQFINLQYQVNYLWRQARPEKYVKELRSSLLPSDLERYFLQAMDLVQGGVDQLHWPITKSIYVLNIDLVPIEKRKDWLKNFIFSPLALEALPVIYSECESSFAIKKWLEQDNDLLAYSYVVGLEMLSPFHQIWQSENKPELQYSALSFLWKELFPEAIIKQILPQKNQKNEQEFIYF